MRTIKIILEDRFRDRLVLWIIRFFRIKTSEVQEDFKLDPETDSQLRKNIEKLKNNDYSDFLTLDETQPNLPVY